MLSIPAALIPVKNRLNEDEPFLLFVKLEFDGNTYYIVNDMTDKTWDGQTWIAYPFSVSEISEGKGQDVPSCELVLANPLRIFQSYFEASNGTAGGSATFYVLHAGSLAGGVNDILIKQVYKMGAATSNGEEISIELTADSPWQKRCPLNRIRRNYCRWRFKSAECGYVGGLTTCDKTLQNCQARANEDNFGGFPGAGRGITGLRI